MLDKIYIKSPNGTNRNMWWWIQELNIGWGGLLASPLFSSSSSCTSSMAKEYWLWGGFMGCMGVGGSRSPTPCWIRPWEHDILVTLPIQSSTGE